MINRIIIFGSQAVLEFQETGTIPSEKWLKENGGIVEEKSFKSIEEHDAYMEGLSDFDEWDDYDYVEKAPVTVSCPHCKEWQSFFADRESNVYCPDCGSLIIPAKSNTDKNN